MTVRRILLWLLIAIVGVPVGLFVLAVLASGAAAICS